MKRIILICCLLMFAGGCKSIPDGGPTFKQKFKEFFQFADNSENTNNAENKVQQSSIKQTKETFLNYINWIMGIAIFCFTGCIVLAYFRFPMANEGIILSATIAGGAFAIGAFIDFIVFILGIALFLLLLYIGYLSYCKFKDGKMKEFLIETIELTKHEKWSDKGRDIAKNMKKPLWVELEIKKQKKLREKRINKMKYNQMKQQFKQDGSIKA